MKNVAQKTEKAIAGAIKVDEKKLLVNLDGLVRCSVADTLNQLSNDDADEICRASKYPRSLNRLETRAQLLTQIIQSRRS